VDLFGHGLSDKPYGIRYTLDLYARQVHDFMRAMNIQKAHIIGHSMGGAIAIKFTDMFPGMTDRLVLVGSAGSRHKGSPTTLFALLRYPLLGEFLINLNFRPVMRKSLSEITFNGRMEINGEYLDRYMLPAGTRGYDYTVLRILRNFNTPEWDASSSLNRIRNDVLIVHGSADRLIDVSRAREMNAALKKSKLVVIKDGPHSVMETDAAAVNNAILGFLQ
jgi:pimeloyl-ACP methyl ester carboxylesterase